MILDLSDEQAALLERELAAIIESDRYLDPRHHRSDTIG
jgi:hypothetical protein